MLGALAVALMGFASCDDELAQPPVNLPEGGIGTGAWDNPMTAYQAHLGSVNENLGEIVWVRGYIVGFVDTNVGNVLKEESAAFTVPATVKTNILIAADPEERNWENCVPVQLPSGNVRNALNLGDHPENQGQEVCIYGQTGSKYCSAYGVRSVTDYNWGNIGIEPDPNTVAPAGSKTILNVSFLNNMQGFTFDQGNPSEEGFLTWKLTEKYGLVATGGIANSNAKTTDAFAISGEISLEGYAEVRLNVHQAANYFNNTETFLQMCSINVREAGTADWTPVSMPLPPAGNSWSFSDSGMINLDSFAGKKIEIGFRYTSTPSTSGTWEIDEMQVYGVPAK